MAETELWSLDSRGGHRLRAGLDVLSGNLRAPPASHSLFGMLLLSLAWAHRDSETFPRSGFAHSRQGLGLQ